MSAKLQLAAALLLIAVSFESASVRAESDEQFANSLQGGDATIYLCWAEANITTVSKNWIVNLDDMAECLRQHACVFKIHDGGDPKREYGEVAFRAVTPHGNIGGWQYDGIPNATCPTLSAEDRAKVFRSAEAKYRHNCFAPGEQISGCFPKGGWTDDDKLVRVKRTPAMAPHFESYVPPEQKRQALPVSPDPPISLGASSSARPDSIPPIRSLPAQPLPVSCVNVTTIPENGGVVIVGLFKNNCGTCVNITFGYQGAPWPMGTGSARIEAGATARTSYSVTFAVGGSYSFPVSTVTRC